MGNVPKATKVFEIDDQPYARCAGPDDNTPCPQRWTDEGSNALAAAKRHAELKPGHRVRVTTEHREIWRAQ